MTFLSLCGRRLNQFVFLGFLPMQAESRARALRGIKDESRAILLMDTPYRLERLLSELSRNMPSRRCVLGINLTAPTEDIIEGPVEKIAGAVKGKKAEFILLLEAYPVKRPGKGSVRNSNSNASSGRRR